MCTASKSISYWQTTTHASFDSLSRQGWTPYCCTSEHGRTPIDGRVVESLFNGRSYNIPTQLSREYMRADPDQRS